jgi:hypothetical protein
LRAANYERDEEGSGAPVPGQGLFYPEGRGDASSIWLNVNTKRKSIDVQKTNELRSPFANSAEMENISICLTWGYSFVIDILSAR